MPITAKAVLRQNLLLRGLAEETLDRIAALAVRRNYSRGAAVFQQGDPGDCLYAVISGQVRVSTHHADGREVFLNLIEAGDSFGEIAAVDGFDRTATATAVVDSSLLLIRRTDLFALMERDPRLAIHLLSVFCKRMRWTSDLIDEAAFLDVAARLAHRLLRLAADHGVAGSDGTTLKLSQAELANFLGASRQVVNQSLQAWREHGWIALARGRVVIRDREALRTLARGVAAIAADP